jgi:O-antigen/teichoic acid export membrane protein
MSQAHTPSSHGEIRDRALLGVAVLTLRQIATRGLGLIGSVILARLLVPEDFGLAALGLSLITVGNAAGNAGLGAALIRGDAEPAESQLSALVGLQIAVTTILAVGVLATVPLFGEGAAVASVFAAAVPFISLRTPSVIISERRLDYRKLARTDVTDIIVYNAWAILGAALGWGVWALASATVVRGAAGSAYLLQAMPEGRIRPRWNPACLRSLLGFGVRFQGAMGIWLVRETAISFGVTAVAGVATLGLMSIVTRLLQIPLMLFEATMRVGFPALARLSESTSDTRPQVEKATATLAIVNAVLAAATIGAAPGLIPALFGERWEDAVGAVPFAALGIVLSGSVTVMSGSVLYAEGAAGTAVRLQIITSLATLPCTLLLADRYGVRGMAGGLLIGSIVEALISIRAVQRQTTASLASGVVVAGVATLFGGGLGWAVSSKMGDTVVSALVGGIVGGLGAIAALLLLQPHRTLGALGVVSQLSAVLRRGRTA